MVTTTGSEGVMGSDRESSGSSADTIEEPSSPERPATDGPLWMEDDAETKRRSRTASLPDSGRPPRDPSAVTSTFNRAKSAEKGIRTLIDLQMLAGGSAAEIASFFLRNDGKLDATKVGDYLGGHEEIQRDALQVVLAAVPLAGLPLDSALRKTIALIKLPGEAQKIDRIIEQFAIRWVAANPGLVDHVDTAQILAFSLVMLNVDAHNDNIKRERKMSLSQVRVASRLRASRCTLMLLAALADVR